MTKRSTQILAPAPHLSPAFSVARGYIDRRGVAKLLLNANVDRLSRLDEFQHAVMMLLVDATSRADIIAQAERHPEPSFEDAVLNGAFRRAVHQIFDLNTARVQSALSLDTTVLPSETERYQTARLYGADAAATWRHIAAEREAYHATECLLAHAAATPDGRMPLSIRQALTEVAAGEVPAPQPELSETYRQWGALVLEQLPCAEECVD
jgi:hypothetical protein